MNVLRRPLAVMAVAGLALTGCSGDDDSGDGADGGDGGDPAATVVEVAAVAGLRFEPSELSAPAGSIRIELTNDDSVIHSLVIDGIDDFKIVDDGGDSAEFAPGEYRYWCDVPGHVEAGMEGTLTVT